MIKAGNFLESVKDVTNFAHQRAYLRKSFIKFYKNNMIDDILFFQAAREMTVNVQNFRGYLVKKQNFKSPGQLRSKMNGKFFMDITANKNHLSGIFL